MPPDLLRAAGPNFLARIRELFVKAMILANEPAQWRGGLLTPLWKGKGSYSQVTNHRAIWLVNCLGKLLHRWLVRRLGVFPDPYLRPTQFGGIKGKDTTLASTTVSAFADWARVSKTPAAIIFLDLSAAFDRVLRQLIVGVVHTTDTMEQLLRKAGVAEELANKFGAFFEQRCILHQMRADESLARIIHNAHVGVWFRMEQPQVSP